MTDEETMDAIAEYRSLRKIMDNAECRTEKQIIAVLGTVLFERMIKLSELTWPQRNEKFKAFNDARL